MLETPKRFVSEVLKWRKAGYPLRPAAMIDAIFAEKCRPCEHFHGGNRAGRCGVCKCFVSRVRAIGNKLAMATTCCPLEDPKWLEYDGATEFAEPAAAKQSHGRGCCG